MLVHSAMAAPTQAMNQLENAYHGFQPANPMIALALMAAVFVFGAALIWLGMRKR